MSVVLPFLLSMLLGRSIDLTSYSIGGNIYDDAQFMETPIRTLNTTFQVLREDASPYASFGVPVDIVLRIKSGYLGSSSGAMGLDGLLKDTTWKHNSVVVAATTLLRTVDRRLAESAKPLQDWTSKIPATQTHYASALYHGGWVVTLFRFQCDVPADVISVRKVLTRHLGAEGQLDNTTVDAWQRALDDLKSDADIRGGVKMTPLVYTSVHLEEQISDPSSLLQVAHNLPGLVGSIGQPIYMELEPIRRLDKSFPEANQSTVMQPELEKLDLMLDDVKIAKSSMTKWLSDTLTPFEDRHEEKIYKLLDVLNGCVRAFHRVGGEVSLFRPMERGMLDPAYHYYLANLERGVANYNLAFLRLKEDIDAGCEDAFLQGIRGLLRVYDSERQEKGAVSGGVAECRELCAGEPRCRAIGYADHLTELDLSTGLYFKKEKQCWIYFRSTSTAAVHTPNGLSGDLMVYDRRCY